MSTHSITAAVLVTGNEILSGRTADANVNTIARRMTDIGICLSEVRMVRDDEKEIVNALNELRQRFTYVFTTGGIGPTHDDITIQCVAKAFGVPIVRNTAVERQLREKLGNKATEATFKMADFPEGARLLATDITAAPGCTIGNVFVMAGIPQICTAMVEAAVPLLKQGEQMYSKALDVFAGEGRIAQEFQQLQDKFPHLEMGSYPFCDEEDKAATSLVVRGTEAQDVDKAFLALQDWLGESGLRFRL